MEIKKVTNEDLVEIRKRAKLASAARTAEEKAIVDQWNNPAKVYADAHLTPTQRTWARRRARWAGHARRRSSEIIQNWAAEMRAKNSTKQ